MAHATQSPHLLSCSSPAAAGRSAASEPEEPPAVCSRAARRAPATFSAPPWTAAAAIAALPPARPATRSAAPSVATTQGPASTPAPEPGVPGDRVQRVAAQPEGSRTAPGACQPVKTGTVCPGNYACGFAGGCGTSQLVRLLRERVCLQRRDLREAGGRGQLHRKRRLHLGRLRGVRHGTVLRRGVYDRQPHLRVNWLRRRRSLPLP